MEILYFYILFSFFVSKVEITFCNDKYMVSSTCTITHFSVPDFYICFVIITDRQNAVTYSEKNIMWGKVAFCYYFLYTFPSLNKNKFYTHEQSISKNTSTLLTSECSWKASKLVKRTRPFVVFFGKKTCNKVFLFLESNKKEKLIS